MFSVQTTAGFESSRLKLCSIDKAKLLFPRSALPCHLFLFSRELKWLVGAPFTVPPTVCNPITGLWDKLPPPAAFQSRGDMKKMLVDKLCFDSRRMPSSFSLDSCVSLPNFCQHLQSNI